MRPPPRRGLADARPDRRAETLKPQPCHLWEVKPGLVARWRALSSTVRRRIVLGSLFGLALAARDLILLTVAGSLLALSELAPAPHRAPAAS